MFRTFRLSTSLAALGVAAFASAASYTSFNTMTSTGLYVSNVAEKYYVELDSGAKANNLAIKDIFGFYLLAADANTSLGTASSQSAPNDWIVDNANGKLLNFAGWDNTSKSNSLKPTHTDPFSFTTVASPVTVYGFHVRYNDGTTFFYKGNASSLVKPAPVPEPITMTLAFAGLGLAARRKLKSS